MGGSQCRLHDTLAGGLQILRELDDQDRVLGRQTDDGDQPDLEVHVVGVRAQQRRQQHAEHAQRHHQNDRQRNGPALVERSQAQKHRQDREGIQNHRLRARQLFFTRLPGPLEAETGRQFRREILHLGHGDARAGAGCRRTGDLDGRVAVVAHRLLRAIDPSRRREGRQRHRIALRVAGVQLEQVVGLHPCRRIGLHHHALQPPLVGEVVDVAGTQRRRERCVDGVEAHAQRIGLVAVDVDLQLRRIFQPVRAHLRQQRTLARHAEQLVARVHQRFMAHPATVLQSESEAAGVAQFGDRWRCQRVDEGIANAREPAEGTPGQPFGRFARTLALVPVFQRHERKRRVLPQTREAEAQHAHHALHLGLLQDVVLDLLDYRQRAFLRRAGRQLHVDDDVALVFLRQERGRQARVQQCHGADDRDVDDEIARSLLEHPRNHAFIAFGRACEAPVEAAEKAADQALLVVMGLLVDRLEQRRAQGRRERQRHQRREPDRRHHHRRELAIDVACRAGKEGQRHEHRDQHHRHPDDGARDLLHRLARGLQRPQAFVDHDALDVLHHHDGVVHHDADHQHHAEHGQHVDREAQRQQHGEGAQQRNRHHDGRNDRVAPVLQEQEHHDEHQRNGFQQRLDHLGDRDADEARGVVRNGPLHARREVFFKLGHLDADRLGSRQRVAARRQLHAHADGRLAVQADRRGIRLAAQLDARDVLQPHGRAVGIGAQHDVAELFDAGQLPIDHHRGRDALARDVRQVAD